MGEKFTNTLLAFAGKMQSNRVLNAIKDSFIDNMPVVIMGSFCTLFQFTICTTADGYISLARVPGLSFLEKLTPIFTTANYGCMNFLAVAVVFLIAIHFSENIGNAHDNTAPAVALASFVTLITTTTTGTMTAGALAEASNGALTAVDETASVTVSVSSVVASS